MIKEKAVKDERWPIGQLYQAFLSLKNGKGWTIEKIYFQKPTLPILALYTKISGPSIWIISGIHGDEPAGPIAIAKNISFFKSLNKKKAPLVLLPLCNPIGYQKNWRYPYHPKELKKSGSVGDAEALLPKEHNPLLPRAKEASCPEASAINSWIIRQLNIHPPKLVIDLHEDEILTVGGDPHYQDDTDKENYFPYIYSQGKLGVDDPVAKEIVKIFIKHHHPLQITGIANTQNKEKIVNSVVGQMKDSSLSEFLATEKIIVNGKLVPGPNAKSVIVVETLTQTLGYPLEERLKIHGEILKSLEKFWKIANS